MGENEIRIGNYLKWKDNQQEFKVTIGLFLDINFWNHIKNNDIGPIPLTEKWALRFGFEHIVTLLDSEIYKNGIYYISIRKGNITFSIKTDSKSSYFPLVRRSKFYVHQLQNLYFDLKGEELILKDK